MLGKPDQTAQEDVAKGALSQLLEHAEAMHAVGAYSDRGLEEARRIAKSILSVDAVEIGSNNKVEAHGGR